MRIVQAEHLNASANNAADSSTATNELNAFRATLQRMQQALAKADQEVEQFCTREADIQADTITAFTNQSNK